MIPKFGTKEIEIQNYLATDPESQREIKEILGIEGESNVEFKREEVFINNITVDFMVYGSIKNKIFSLIECKGTNINVTEYVRGIGQTLQYEYFYEEKIKPKNNSNFTYIEKFQTLFLLTSDFMKKTDINIAKFKYPNTLKIVEINTGNHNLRVIDHKELKRIDKNTDENTKALNFYYFRDNRIFELFILLRYISISSLRQQEPLDRTEIDTTLKNNVKVINNGNWRNAFITLSSLGLIESNRPTNSGSELLVLDYADFAYEIYHNYLKDYVKCILEIMIKYELFDSSQKDIVAKIKEDHSGYDILYLTQSDHRYLSSFLSIMRDDYGILEFKSGSNKRTFNYNILELKKEYIIRKIKEETKAYKYIDDFFIYLKQD